MKTSITPSLRMPAHDNSHRKTHGLQVLQSLLECALYSKKFHKIFKCLHLGFRLRSHPHFLARAIEVLTVYEYFQRNFQDSDILLVDHGIIQNIISFCYLKDLPGDSFPWDDSLPHLLASEHTFVIVNCHLSTAKAIERIRRRVSQHGRIARLSDKRKESALHIQSRNFETLRGIATRTSTIHTVNIEETEGMKSLSEIMQSVCEELRQLLHVEKSPI